jgi:hypothetical protein
MNTVESFSEFCPFYEKRPAKFVVSSCLKVVFLFVASGPHCLNPVLDAGQGCELYCAARGGDPGLQDGPGAGGPLQVSLSLLSFSSV